ncbi:pyruvate dehydrogenase complex dihydrolipoamide acetyltransferase [Amycolatopsis endophytica]|uniref:Dihydrolipoamide acetyltransferase component of pyruvate dehydrogenase complex n=1 Tax=Amycolatopsis endophytica TaxID=860233 RepID=A0A853B7K3_9PSEU|nr:dihydrolipoamide acetyltransferase family protein [Amycolatopsis endophytica]NYI90772.1 pyruvate dehydrogenase E2 component (dihydrolipoamide acetyltransferase) [Amycolatopsis endophytica]
MIDILMPRLSDTMEEGVISSWHFGPGDHVTTGQVLAEIETDKAIMEFEAYQDGTLTEILVPAGSAVPIGAPIARLDDGSGDAPEPAREAPAAEPVPAAPPLPQEGNGRLAATPLVRRLAREHGIDLAGITGSGPRGRIVRADIEDALRTDPAPAEPAEPAAAGATRVPFDAVRHAVATRLADSATIPTFTATASADVDALLTLRAQINEAPASAKVTVNDLVVRAVALALRAHPGINASYSPEGRGATVLHEGIHVGIAVSSPSGLVVPVVRDADRSPVTAIAVRTRELAGRAADRTLSPADMAGGTCTVSNLGMFGVEQFTAIINPPQGAILAVGAALGEPRRMRYTLTADHRIIDGALAGQFLATLTGLLEHPLRAIA